MTRYEWVTDPTGRFDHRLRVDGQLTATVSAGGSQLVDPDPLPAPRSDMPPPAHPRPEMPPPSGTTPLPPPGTAPPGVPAATSAPRTRTAGDQIVSALGTITLASWGNKMLARSMGVPDLVEAVRAAPDAVGPRLHLGLRLLEMSKVNTILRKQQAPTSVVGLVARPVVRAAGKALTTSLSSDPRPAHQQVLQPLFHHLGARVTAGTATIEQLVALARISWEGTLTAQHHEQALRTINVARTMEPWHGEALYVGAEILIDLGRLDEGVAWARSAHQVGYLPAIALLRDDAPARRDAFRFPRRKGLLGYHVDDFLEAERRYYEGVPPQLVLAHRGLAFG